MLVFAPPTGLGSASGGGWPAGMVPRRPPPLPPVGGLLAAFTY